MKRIGVLTVILVCLLSGCAADNSEISDNIRSYGSSTGEYIEHISEEINSSDSSVESNESNPESEHSESSSSSVEINESKTDSEPGQSISNSNAGSTESIPENESNENASNNSSAGSSERDPEPEHKEETNMAQKIPQTGMTKSVPSFYMTPTSKQGTVERITYDSENYAGNGEAIQKTAYVYLPYGYSGSDTQTKYDILYLMHGWGGSSGEYFTVGNGMIKNMLDRMIENGEISPMIVVSATFYNDSSSRDFGSSVRELRQFHQDFANHLMTAVEGRYHTYAKSTLAEELAASRDHRAFGGFSLGSVTTWNQFCYNSDYIRYFLPMSGACWYYGGYGDYYPEETCDFFEKLIEDNSLNERGYFIYAATGTNDAVRDQVDILMDEMLERKDFFTSDHVVYYLKEGGVHNFNAIIEYMYNALPLFFRL